MIQVSVQRDHRDKEKGRREEVKWKQTFPPASGKGRLQCLWRRTIYSLFSWWAGDNQIWFNWYWAWSCIWEPRWFFQYEWTLERILHFKISFLERVLVVVVVRGACLEEWGEVVVELTHVWRWVLGQLVWWSQPWLDMTCHIRVFSQLLRLFQSLSISY